MRNALVLLGLGIGVMAAVGCSRAPEGEEDATVAVEAKTLRQTTAQRIMFVDSYHRGYKWSDGVLEGLLRELNIRLTEDGGLDAAHSPYELRVFHMDTKRHPSTTFKREAALKAKSIIESWRPDIVVTADDNAAKYLIVPHFKGTRLPFIFCGINWDAGRYGFPAANVTGMVEVSLIGQEIGMLARFARGRRLGLLGADVETNLKHAENLRSFDPDLKLHLVRSMDDWQTAFRALQAEVDIAFVAYSQSVTNWDVETARVFALKHTRIPTGSWNDWLLPLTLISVAKDPAEQGEWAARAAKRVLSGTPVSAIPVARNKRAKLYLNMALAEKLGIVFPVQWVQQAEIFRPQRPRILFVNSYHTGYGWSDGIERGFCRALGLHPEDIASTAVENSRFQVRFERMDSKNHPDEDLLRAAASRIRGVIADWQPDLIVLSDDNAVRYLVDRLRTEPRRPVLFCGVNWDIADYGLPAPHIRGMIEVDPMDQVVQALKRHSEGDRVGFIGANLVSNHKVLAAYRERLNIAIGPAYTVDTFDQWKNAFARLQGESDLLICSSASGVQGWDGDAAVEFAKATVRVPTGTTLPTMMGVSMLGIVRVPEEQGWWVGQQAKRILGGKTGIDHIEVTANQNNRMLLNLALASQVGIAFAPELIKAATIVEAPTTP